MRSLRSMNFGNSAAPTKILACKFPRCLRLRQLQSDRRFAEAESAYLQILAHDAENADALQGLGWLAHQVGQDQIALQLLDRAVALRRTDHLLHWRIAVVSERLGQAPRADAAYARACELKPRERDLLGAFGLFLARIGQLDRAIDSFKRTVKIDPGFAQGYLQLGMAFDQLGKFPEAESAFRQSLRLNPHAPGTLQRLGQTLGKAGRLEEAIECLQQALRMDPDHFDANFNLAIAYRMLGRNEDTIAPLERALAVSPDSTAVLEELARNYSDLNLQQKALPLLDKAIALKPGDTELRSLRALALLAIGELPQGFREYEIRWKSKTFPQNPRFSHVPQWTGFDIAGKTILLHTEQGFGDSIQFIRYAPLIVERGARVLLQAGKEILPLLMTVGRIAEGIETDRTVSAFDVRCALLSLPFAFGTTLQTIPATVPYLHPDPQNIEQWKPRLEAPAAARKIGLVWAGRPTHRRDRQRSMSLEMLAPLADVAGATYFSLQKGKAAEERIDGFDLIQIGPDLKDFADTAAVIAQLDLVISVDTAVAHLAGALGKPVWTLIGSFTDFRWMLGREDTPWYPTMRLFRQSRRDDWASVIERVVADLKAHHKSE